MQTLLQDVRYAVRMLAKNKAFATWLRQNDFAVNSDLSTGSVGDFNLALGVKTPG